MLVYKESPPSLMPLDQLTRSFREWFARDPWQERWRCPRCNAFSDFGALGRFAEYREAGCPTCHTALLPYWTDERVLEYYFAATRQPGFAQVLGFDETGQPQSWLWGYALKANADFADFPEGGFYGDHIGVAPRYRGEDSRVILREAQKILEAQGFTYFVVRTHRAASYVVKLFCQVGFAPLAHESAEPDRHYFAYDPRGRLA